MKPPNRPTINARVLERRQKDLDGFNEKYQGIIDARQEKYAEEIRPTWQRIARKSTDELKAIYNQLQDANGVPIKDASNIDRAKMRNMLRKQEQLASLQAQLVKLMGTDEQAEKLKNNLAYSYSHAYYFGAFGTEQAAKVAISTPILTESHVMGIINNPWLPDGKTYSDRIRTNTAYLAAKMADSLEEAIGSGWGVNRLARRVQEVAGEGYHNSVRLARTELNRAASMGTSHLYMQNADIMDGKRWNATLDARTAPKDADNDGKIYDLDYDTPENPGKPGERIPNHPNCRCKYSPVLSALGVSTRERIARGEGDSKNQYGERTYTKARTYREYAKERGLPDLDDRLRNDNPRRYLRRGETMAAYAAKKTPATKKVVEKVAAAEGFKQAVEARIAQGVKTEADAVEVGDLVRQEIEKNLPPDTLEMANRMKDLKAEQDQNYARHNEIRKMDLFKRQPFVEEMDQAARRWHELKNEIADLQKKVAAAQGEATRATLQQIVPLGNPGTTSWAKGTHKVTREAYDAITPYLPSSWLQASNEGKEMVGRKVKRGHYSQGHSNAPAEFYVSGDTAAARAKVALHEMGHRMEHIKPEIKRLEYEFYQRRTAGEAKKTLPGYSSSEKGRLDDFLNPYMGKDYGNTENSYYEILSMGLEGVFMATTPIHTDRDYYNFILGVLVSIK